MPKKKREEGKARRKKKEKEKGKRKIEITKNADCDETKTKTDDYVAWFVRGAPLPPPPYLLPLSFLALLLCVAWSLSLWRPSADTYFQCKVRLANKHSNTRTHTRIHTHTSTPPTHSHNTRCRKLLATFVWFVVIVGQKSFRCCFLCWQLANKA